MIDINQDGIDDIQQIKEFVIGIADDAWNALLEALRNMIPKAVAALRAAALTVINGIVEHRPFGEIVADVFTVLYREFKDVADQIESRVVSSYMALVHGPALVAK